MPVLQKQNLQEDEEPAGFPTINSNSNYTNWYYRFNAVPINLRSWKTHSVGHSFSVACKKALKHYYCTSLTCITEYYVVIRINCTRSIDEIYMNVIAC